MKTLSKSIVCLTLISAPLSVFAQTTNAQPLTRAQVIEQLIQVEKAGYQPSASAAYYPADIEAAERRVQAQQATANAQSVSDTSYGSSTNGS